MKKLGSIYQRILVSDRAYWLNTLIIIALSILSFYTTFDGFSRYILVEDQTATGFEIIFLIIVVAIIQLLLIVSLSNLIRYKTWNGRSIWIALYIITMLVSVFFSYSFYYKLMQADSYAQKNFSIQLNQSLLNAQNYQSSFMEVTETVKLLSSYSQETAKRERLKGGTCGDHSPAGSGPRRDLREEEAELFTQLSETTTQLSTKLVGEMQALNDIKARYSTEKNNTATIQQEMNTVINRINHQRNTAAIKQLKQILQQHMGEARQNLWVEIRQTKISCPDQRISQSVKGLLLGLNDLPILDEIVLFDSNDDKAIMARAMHVFINIPSIIYNALLPLAQADAQKDNSKNKVNANEISNADISPFILGSMVDAIIFLIGFSNAKKSQQRNYLNGRYAGEFFSTRDIVRIQSAFNIRDLRKILRLHLYNTKSERYFIIPSEVYVQLPHSNALINLFESLVSANRIAKPKHSHIPLDVIAESVKDRLAPYFINHSARPLFNYYPIKEDSWNDLVQSLNAYSMWNQK